MTRLSVTLTYPLAVHPSIVRHPALYLSSNETMHDYGLGRIHPIAQIS